MNQYKTNNLEIAQVIFRVLCDKHPEKADALFIHGEMSEPQIEKSLSCLAAEVWRTGKCPVIVVNGLSAEYSKSKNQGYSGYETFLKDLVALGVPREAILIMTSSENTATESENFLKLAKENNWHTVIIEAAPYHQPRCFLQIVAAMKKLDIHVQVYNMTFQDVDWSMWVKRKVMNGENVLGQKDEEGMLIDMFKSELERIERYAIASPDHITSSTIAEGMEYFRKRDAKEGRID